MAAKKKSKKKQAKAKKAPTKKAFKPVKKAAKKAAKKTVKKTAKKAPQRSTKKVTTKGAKKVTKPTPAAKTGPVSAPPMVGSNAPAFALGGDDGATHTLAGHAGSPVVVYFYPRDDTPGCTTEACDFRDNMARATAKGAVVYGISRDSLVSHTKFKAKHNLNFTLLSDPDLVTHRAYGAWGEKVMYGKATEGVLRSTYLVDKNGKVAAAWPRVKVNGHVDAVLAALDQLGG